MTDEPMIETLVCRRWPVKMPEHRANRPGWSYWEQERLSYMHAVIRPGDVVWEIGAEQGDVSVLYALWGADVVLVEPDEEMWKPLWLIFGANGMNAKMLHAEHASVARYATFPPEEPPRTTLDLLLESAPVPNVVSIDIEGDEYQALLGADVLLAEVKPILFISVHPDFLWDKHKDTPDDVWMHLELHGYTVERLGRDHEIHIIAKPRP